MNKEEEYEKVAIIHKNCKNGCGGVLQGAQNKKNMNELFLNWYFTTSVGITLLLLLFLAVQYRNEILSDIKRAINNPYSEDTLLMLTFNILVFIGAIITSLFFSPIVLAVFLPILLINTIIKLWKS